MELYSIKVIEANKVWKNLIVFAERFLLEGNKNIAFSDFFLQNSKLNELKIEALNDKGDIIKYQDYFTKETMPPFCMIRNTVLIREDIFKEELFKDLVGIMFYTVKVDGDFEFCYRLLSFTKALDCVDREKSIKTEYLFFSKLVLQRSNIPPTVNGFFLSGWRGYGRYNSIVDSKMKNILLKLEKASQFLIFDRIEIN